MAEKIIVGSLEEAWQSAKDGTTGVAVEADVKYQRDPVGWAVNVLGIPEHTIRWSLNPGYQHHEWDATPDPIVAVAEAIGRGEDVGVESATGVGKTFAGAWIALWFLACFPDAIIITTAPKETQLTTQLWKEIGKQWPKFSAKYPHASTVELRVRMREGKGEAESWAIIGYACGVDAGSESATRAQGFHAPHMLIITEETPGIDGAVMAALANTCSGSHNIRLAFGNPDSQQDELHRFCLMEGVTHIRISAFDHPNVVTGREIVPGASSPKGIQTIKRTWGEGTSMYDSRARGISPAQATNALIHLEWCNAAAERYKDPNFRKGRMAKGVDVANSVAGDKAAIATGQGACLLEVRAFACPDSNQLGRDVFSEMTRDDVRPEHVGVDPVGVGAGTVNELRPLTKGYGVQELNGGASPIERTARGLDGSTYEWVTDANVFNNFRSQMYWQMREDLRNGLVALPPDNKLFSQLTAIHFTTKNGKTIVESKEEIKKRFRGQSPDEADAVVYWNWVRPRAAVPVAVPKRAEGEFMEGRDTGVFVPLDANDGWNDDWSSGGGTGQSLGNGW